MPRNDSGYVSAGCPLLCGPEGKRSPVGLPDSPASPGASRLLSILRHRENLVDLALPLGRRPPNDPPEFAGFPRTTSRSTAGKKLKMSTDRYGPHTALEQRVSRLEEELYWLRRAIVELMPADISKAFSDYGSCKSHQEYAEWKRRTVDFIISKAEVDPQASHFEERGWCPLCKGGTRGPYQSGFKIPGGLEKHLMGDGNASQCVVTKAAFDKAQHALHDEFEASEEAARREVEERRKTEQTLLINPSLPPELFDERQWWSKPRPADALAAAEHRLHSLNFQKELTGNVVAYRLWHEGRLVLADPRRAGRITFRVFNNEKPKKGSKQVSFDLVDGWKNNLTEKFRGLLTEACSAPPRRR
jgi:hypothetical protein